MPKLYSKEQYNNYFIEKIKNQIIENPLLKIWQLDTLLITNNPKIFHIMPDSTVRLVRKKPEYLK